MTRANDIGEPQERVGFSKFEDHVTRAEVYEHLDESGRKGGYHYRIVMAPETDRNAENVDMKAYARDMMNRLEIQMQKTLDWVGFEHVSESAYSEHGHVHLIVTTPRRLDREDLEQLRAQARQGFSQGLENRPEQLADLDGGGFVKDKELLEQRASLEAAYESGLCL